VIRLSAASHRYSRGVADDLDTPQLSVVIPVRNGGATLARQLDALAAAEPPGVSFEVVVADNGSTDDTVAIVHAYADRLPIRVIDAGRAPGVNVARNEGVAAAVGRWILLCDADDEVDRDWLRTMCSAFVEGRNLLGGVIDYGQLNSLEAQAWRGATKASVAIHLGYLPSAHGANIGFDRHLFDTIKGFDERFIYGGEDVEFCWRAQLAGFELHEEPTAIVHYRLRPDLRSLWHQYRHYGSSEPLLFRAFRESGLERRPVAATLRDTWWLITRLPFAFRRPRRGAWVRRAGMWWGRLRGSVQHRTLWL